MKKVTKKVVKGWMIVNRRYNDEIYAAYTDKETARDEMNRFPAFHRRDVVRPCTITYQLP